MKNNEKKTNVYNCNELVISNILKITIMKLRFYFNKLKKWKISINKKEQCNICLNNISSLDRIKTICNHTFCESCLKTWTQKNNNCPICRTTFTENMSELDKEYLISLNYYRISLNDLNTENIDRTINTVPADTIIADTVPADTVLEDVITSILRRESS